MFSVICVVAPTVRDAVLENNELYSSIKLAEERFKELVLERHPSITEEDLKRACAEGRYMIGYTTLFWGRPTRNARTVW